MEHFIRRENIRRYRQLLDQETDEQKRNVIRKLLAEEEANECADGSARTTKRSEWAVSAFYYAATEAFF